MLGTGIVQGISSSVTHIPSVEADVITSDKND